MIEIVKTALRANPYARKYREQLLTLYSSRITATRRFATLCEQSGIEFILDVGANVGQFARDVRRHEFKERIYSYEPIHASYDKLVNNFKKDANWKGFNLALGMSKGAMEINLSGNSGLSTSFLEMKQEHLSSFPNSRYIGRQIVQISTISDQIEELGIDPGLVGLKIDVQGFEMEVLKGAGSLLGKIPIIMFEASLRELYEGEPKLRDMLTFLSTQGHEVTDIFRGISNAHGDLLQVDIITKCQVL